MIIALAVVAVAAFVLARTRFGRTVYAIGGNEGSALLMGLRVARTKVGVYAISGFCAALAGLLFSFYTLSGYSLNAVGMELDAIAAVVIGGTLLTGGRGLVVGSCSGSWCSARSRPSSPSTAPSARGGPGSPSARCPRLRRDAAAVTRRQA